MMSPNPCIHFYAKYMDIRRWTPEISDFLSLNRFDWNFKRNLVLAQQIATEAKFYFSASSSGEKAAYDYN